MLRAVIEPLIQTQSLYSSRWFALLKHSVYQKNTNQRQCAQQRSGNCERAFKHPYRSRRRRRPCRSRSRSSSSSRRSGRRGARRTRSRRWRWWRGGSSRRRNRGRSRSRRPLSCPRRCWNFDCRCGCRFGRQTDSHRLFLRLNFCGFRRFRRFSASRRVWNIFGHTFALQATYARITSMSTNNQHFEKRAQIAIAWRTALYELMLDR